MQKTIASKLMDELLKALTSQQHNELRDKVMKKTPTPSYRVYFETAPKVNRSKAVKDICRKGIDSITPPSPSEETAVV